MTRLASGRLAGLSYDLWRDVAHDLGLNWQAKEYDLAGLLREAAAVEAKLARHKGLEDEAKQLKAALRATENTQAELVAAARAKIDAIEARRVIVERLHRQLVLIYEAYLRADQRACLAALENLHAKYAVTAAEIEQRRDAATARLKGFLGELGYE